MAVVASALFYVVVVVGYMQHERTYGPYETLQRCHEERAEDLKGWGKDETSVTASECFAKLPTDGKRLPIAPGGPPRLWRDPLS